MTIAFTVNQKSSGISGGGFSSTPSNEAQITGDGSGSLDITVKDSGAESELSTEQSGLIFDGKSLVVTMPEIDCVTDYAIGIPVSGLSAENIEGSITLKSSVGKITLPSNMLSGTDAASGSTAQVTIGEVDPSDLPAGTQASVGGRPVISLSLTIDGVQTDWSNPKAPVTVSIPYIPTAEELKKPKCIVIWYIDGDGNLSCVTNGYYDAKAGIVTFETTHFSNFVVGYNAVAFEDVASNALYYDAVTFCAAREITRGTGNGMFSPDDTLTRGQFIVMLMRAYGIDADEEISDNFADAGNTYYTGYLSAAKRLAGNVHHAV